MGDGNDAAADRSSPDVDAHPIDWAAARARLVRFAVKLLWNRADADEVVQEAMALAVQKGAAAEGAHLDAWLTRTVAHLCLNRRRRRTAASLNDAALLASGAPPDRLAQRREELQRLRDAIACLPDRQRIAITLRAMEHQDYAEIARTMNLSEPAVRTHVHLARQRLAERLREKRPTP